MKRRIASCVLLIAMLLTNVTLAAEQEPVRIAIIDSGVSTQAIDAGKIVGGRNYILPDQSTEDLVGHGTGVTSIIVGSSSAGVSGVCPSAEIVPMVFNSQVGWGTPVKGDVDLIAEMIRDAIDIYACDIINISLVSKTGSKNLEEAVEYAREKGVLIVASSGNNGEDIVCYPSGYDSVLSVGALDKGGDSAAHFSNRSGTLDLVAPGVEVKLALPDGTASTNSGTSFSTAYVSGLAAKLMMENPLLTPDQICQILCASAIDIGETGFDLNTGWGAVDAGEAMKYVREGRQFRDVKTTDWFFAGAKDMANLGLMKGTDAVHFTPQQTTSRAMLWVMLHRMDGQAVSANGSTWYSDAQDWVMANSIADGKDPNGVISREEITLTLWRYARYKGMDVDSVSYDLTTFPDASSVGKDALAAMEWACGTGLINGMDGMLAPAGNTTRAQIATILTRFLTLL